MLLVLSLLYFIVLCFFYPVILPFFGFHFPFTLVCFILLLFYSTNLIFSSSFTLLFFYSIILLFYYSFILLFFYCIFRLFYN